MRAFIVFSLAVVSYAAVVRHEPDALCCGWSKSPLAAEAMVMGLEVTFHLQERNSDKVASRWSPTGAVTDALLTGQGGGPGCE